MTTEVRVHSPFTKNAQRLICKRYAHRGPNHPMCISPVHAESDEWPIHHEDTQELLDRIAMGQQEYMDVLFNPIRFLPNSPTIFNLPCAVCGQTEPSGTMSACFKFDVDDSMVSIMNVAQKAAMVLKYGGGVGYYVGGIRAKNTPIRSTHGRACGPIEVIKTYQRVAEMITQAGKRDAAQMAILDIDHPDIREFIHLKDTDPQLWNYFNISIAMSDSFMSSVEQGEQLATELWQEIIESAWKTGDPGMYFKDVAERENPTPWLGKLTGTNPCGEVPLLDNEPCNLGSINLGMFVGNQEIRWEELELVVKTAVRYLDEILDRNIFPTKDITDAALLTRKLGLGVMGWADMLAELHLPYDSQQAVDLGWDVMKFIERAAHEESASLARSKGIAPCFKTQEKVIEKRNATLTCIAPTGSISWLADCSGGIEPHFELEYTHTMGDGDTTVHKAHYPADFTPKLANEINVEWHLKHLAAFQKHTDLAVSKTINLPNSATVKEVSDAYMKAWEMGCKGVTVFRDGCRAGGEQVLRSTHFLQVGEVKVQPSITTVAYTNGNGNAPIALQPVRHRLESERDAKTHRFQVADQEGYLTVGLFPDGSPGEVFVKISKEGSTVSGLMDAIGILTSVALQYGVPLAAITRKFRHMRFDPSGMTDNPEQRHASSLLDYIFGWIERKFVAPEVDALPSGECCPDCGAALIHAEGCIRCSSCSYERCG